MKQNHQKIELTLNKKQYELLMRVFTMGGIIYDLLGDMVDEEYKPLQDQIDSLESKLLHDADSYQFEDVEEYDNKKMIDMESEFYASIIDDLDRYEEYSLEDNFSRKLAWRDFEKDFSRKEIEEKAKKNHGYFGADLYDYEKKYWDEIEKHGYKRFDIVENKKAPEGA